MTNAARFSLVLVTAPDLKTARRLARSALAARLIACANLVPRVESLYWWQGKITTGREVLLVLKTTRAQAKALEKLLLAQHPYDTPEILLVPLTQGTNRYLKWLAESMKRLS